MKVCNDCKISKEFSEFSKSAINKDGHKYKCLACYRRLYALKAVSTKKAKSTPQRKCLVCSTNINHLNVTAKICQLSDCINKNNKWRRTEAMMERATNEAFNQRVAYRKQVEYSNFLADDFLDTDEFYSGLSSFMESNSPCGI